MVIRWDKNLLQHLEHKCGTWPPPSIDRQRVTQILIGIVNRSTRDHDGNLLIEWYLE
jgi:hypothetical protein